jgi:flavodoxin
MKVISMIMVVSMMLCCPINAQEQSNKTLVTYFSVTGTTEKAAKLIVEVTGGTLYEIQPEKEYVTADLDWHDKSSRSSVEMTNAESRPALKSKPENLADYDIIYIGFPIWWNSAPRIINTFIESNDFAGKVVIPFATSGGSSISNAEKKLRETYPDMKWQKGQLLNGATKEDIKKWAKK